MKFIWSIVAIIVIALSFMPCADVGIVSRKNKMETVKAQHPEKANDHTDACSPFCQCACCAGFSINHSIASISALPVICTKQFTWHLISPTANIFIPIWQPPKLIS